MNGRLPRLLRPSSIAVIGGEMAARVLANCQAMGFDGDLWAVHPHRPELAGVRSVASVTDLPDPPDAAFVAVGNVSTVNVVAQLAAMGSGGAVCYAAGFAEAGNIELNDELLDAAGEMPLIGPNCHGFINALDRAALWPDQHGCSPIDSGVAVITQSGNLGINLSMQQRGLNLAAVLTLGNQASVTIEECVEALLDDGRVTAIGIHLEGIVDPARFGAAAIAAHRRRIPIVALDAGRSQRGAAITRSHTASMQSDGTTLGALFERYGIARVDRLPDLLETLHVMDAVGTLGGNRMASLSCSGGEATLVADRAHHHGVTFPEFAPDQAARIRDALGERVSITNPLDYHTFVWGDQDTMTTCFAETMAGDHDINMLVLDAPTGDGDPTGWWPTIDAFVHAAEKTSRPGLVVSTIGETLTEAVRDRLAATSIPGISGIDEALGAVGRAAWIGARHDGPTPAPHRPSGVPLETKLLDDVEAKQRLAVAGIPVPPGHLVAADDVVTAAEAVGYPVALKAMGWEHKTEADAVRVALASRAEIEAALAAIADADQYLVERHIAGSVAEVVVSIRRSPPIGWLLTVGSGGWLVELAGDVAHLLAPASDEAIREALSSTNAGQLIAGFRGRAPGDIDATVAAVRALQDAALTPTPLGEVSVVEIEVNPLLVLPVGVWAVDASVTVEVSI